MTTFAPGGYTVKPAGICKGTAEFDFVVPCFFAGRVISIPLEQRDDFNLFSIILKNLFLQIAHNLSTRLRSVGVLSYILSKILIRILSLFYNII